MVMSESIQPVITCVLRGQAITRPEISIHVTGSGTRWIEEILLMKMAGRLMLIRYQTPVPKDNKDVKLRLPTLSQQR